MSNSSSQVPRSVSFRKEREASWQELEDIVQRVQRKSLSVLSDHELQRLPILYREAMNSLSVARATALDRSLIVYLEALCARGYLVVYGSRKPVPRMFWALFVSIPQQIRRAWLEMLLSTVIFVAGIGVAWTLTSRDPAWFGVFVSKKMASGRGPWASTKSLQESLYSVPKDSKDKKRKARKARSGRLSVFSSMLFLNNASVGLFAFALGFLLGLPVVLMLFYNGLVLGAFLSVYASRGLLLPFLGWLLPHGVPELFAILLCGGGGFMLARAMLMPGRLRRGDALRNMGLRASLIVVGAVVLFAYAALFEGFFRQWVVMDEARFGMVLVQVLLLVWWFRIAARPASRELAAESFEADVGLASASHVTS